MKKNEEKWRKMEPHRSLSMRLVGSNPSQPTYLVQSLPNNGGGKIIQNLWQNKTNNG